MAKLNKKQQDEVDELVKQNDKDVLIALAEKKGVDTTGTKHDIAERIVLEAEPDEAGDDDDDDEGADDGESEAAPKDEEEPAKLTKAQKKASKDAPALEEAESASDSKVDQTGEAAVRQRAAARKEAWVKAGGDPDGPIPDDFGEKAQGEKDDDED